MPDHPKGQWKLGPRGEELHLDCGLVLLEWHCANKWCVTCEALGVHCLLLDNLDREGARREALRELLAYVRLAEGELAQYVEAN
jgi:hypothetical protein